MSEIFEPPRLSMMTLYIRDWDGYSNAIRMMNILRKNYDKRELSVYLYRLGV